MGENEKVKADITEERGGIRILHWREPNIKPK